MIPEVYEVFELLEFHYILKAFDNLQDAVADFERSGMVPAAKVTETGTTAPAFHSKETAYANPIAETVSIAKERTLEDKIRNIVKEMPFAGTIQIARQLNTPEYGNEKIGWFGLRKILKRMGLDSKQKRIGHSRTA
jgi:hypothetical protein